MSSRYIDKEELVVMKFVNDSGGEGCVIEEKNKMIDVRCINGKLNKKQIEGVNCKDKPVSDESNNLRVWYENRIEGENGMFEGKSKHNKNGKVFVNDKKDVNRLNQPEKRKVECILMVSDSTDLNRGATDGIMEVVDALLDVVMKMEKDSKDYSCEIGRDEVEAKMEYSEWIYTVIDYEKKISDESPIDEIRIKYIIVNTNSNEMDQTNSRKFEYLPELSSEGTLNVKFANMNDVESEIRIETDEHRVYWYCQRFNDESYGKEICDDEMTGNKNELKERVDLECSYQNDDVEINNVFLYHYKIYYKI
ncbi:27720_t:CDS:2, partial [Gigaspora margarita]